MSTIAKYEQSGWGLASTFQTGSFALMTFRRDAKYGDKIDYIVKMYYDMPVTIALNSGQILRNAKIRKNSADVTSSGSRMFETDAEHNVRLQTEYADVVAIHGVHDFPFTVEE